MKRKLKIRRFAFWVHLVLGILAGLAGALMAGTGVIMAFADSYLDLREHSARKVSPPADTQPLSLYYLVTQANAAHPDKPVIRIGLDRNPHRAYEFYYNPQGLDYVDPYSGATRASDSVPLRRTLHKDVEQWHRFLGFEGKHKDKGRFFMIWCNAALIPLFLSGIVLWWPKSLRWPVIRAGFIPKRKGRDTKRSWHTVLGFWVLPLLLTMVVTGAEHSFVWVRKTAIKTFASTPAKPGSNDSLWAPNLPTQPIPAEKNPLTLDELLVIADLELPGWTRLDIVPAPPPKSNNQIGSVRLTAKAPGRGPAFFTVVIQLHPYSGTVIDIHSWDDLSSGTKLAAWSRWLHKGEAFGRTGQIIAGLACVVMLVLIYTGWALAIRRLARSLKAR